MEKKGITLGLRKDCILIDTLSFIILVHVHEAQSRITIVIIYQHYYKCWKHVGEKKYILLFWISEHGYSVEKY